MGQIAPEQEPEPGGKVPDEMLVTPKFFNETVLSLRAAGAEKEGEQEAEAPSSTV